MIKAVGEQEKDRVLAFCGDTFFGARITGAIRSYGLSDTHQSLYREEKDGSIRCVLLACEGIGVLTGTPVCAEEWTQLCRFTGLHTVTGEEKDVRGLGLPLSRKGTLMRLDAPVRGGDAAPGLVKQVDAEHIASLYDVIHGKGAGQANPASFAAWFVDVSHRVRHGTSRFYAVWEDAAPVSCAGVLYENDAVACIGAVSTLPPYRRKGYASAVTACAAAGILRDGKTAMLARTSDKTKHLYAALGFTDCGTWACAAIEEGN